MTHREATIVNREDTLMSTISSVMNNAVSGLLAQQAAMNTANSNISNAETAGYSRQTVSLRASADGGVQSCDVRRVYDSFLQNRLNAANEELGEYEVRQEYLSAVEAVFTEDEDYGLSASMSEFWSAWQDLANNPSGSTERTLLVAAAGELAAAFNEMSTELTGIQRDIDRSVSSSVDEINSLTSRLAALNAQILRAESSGQSSNTLKDVRDELVTELSAYLDINTFENNQGMVSIQLSNGLPLVDGSSSWSLDTVTNTSSGLQDAVWLSGNGDASVVTGALSGGALGGSLAVRDELIPDYLAQLDELAASLAEAVNSVLTAGYDADGQPGQELFSGTTAAGLAVRQNIIDDPGLVAAAATADGAPGDSTNALAVAELQDSFLMSSGRATFAEFYSSLVSQVGNDADEAETACEQAEDTLQLCKNYRDSVSGVSTDEELALITQHQYAYEASARAISILQELLDTIVNM